MEVEADSAAGGGEEERSFVLRAGGASLRVTLPALYPLEQLPLISLSCPSARPEPLAEAARELEATAAQGATGGMESCSELAQRFLELVAAGALSAPAKAAPAPTGEQRPRAADAARREELIVRLDHMNNAPAYMRRLEEWAAGGGYAGVLLYAEAGQSRARDVIVVLQGECGELSSFLQRLRTELVDVDGKGRRCKERCSTVLCRRPAGTFKEGYRTAAELRGWRVARYASAEERDELLDELGVLHVGSGAERFAHS